MNVQSKERSIPVKEGQTAAQIAKENHLNEPHQALAALVNGTLVDLNTPLKEGDHLEFVHFENALGKEVFWHSSAHILAQAVLRLYPDAKPTIGPAIENGFYYDFANLQISEEDLPKIEKEFQKIAKENHEPLRTTFANKEEALKAFQHNPYKAELIQELDPSFPITAYRQGEFFDLCRGPHLPSLGKVKAVKLTKTSGAYWRGDPEREMLTRIYGITFPDRGMLKDYLTMMEEAKKRDHRLLGAKLDLFSFREEAPGMPFIHPHGMIVWEHLMAFWRKLHRDNGYVEIKTPTMMTQHLWEQSGHWEHYQGNMFLSEIENRQFAIKPMNCPGCMLYYKESSHSYRNLPLRIAEIGHVHRFEPSGALHGMFRVRSFHQDDAHVFMKPTDIQAEILKVLQLADRLYSAFDLSYHLELSTRPEKSIGSDEEWERATEGLRSALEEWNKPFIVNEGDGAFYGPKIDLHVKDAIGRSWQCGTIQLDMSLPEKFDLTYTDSDGLQKRPIMIHRALYGSIERFLGILVEHYAGKFPLWLSPRQVRLITVADRHRDYAQTVQKHLQQAGLLCDLDDSQESVSKKIRNAQLHQVNYMLTIGDQELETQSLNVRTRDNVIHGKLSLQALLAKLKQELKTSSI